jgi:vacuolar-type H+-ATPase subunit I/STV1
MFGLFNKKSPIEKLQETRKQLLDEAFQLSKTDRTASDKKTAEANAIDNQIEALRAKE